MTTVKDKKNTIRSRFMEAVKDHEMAVLRDNEVNRHIRLSRPGSSTYRFDLITWPGYLTICGDIGTYVFSRVPDMFTFFRSGNGEHEINPSYWSEKLEACDTRRATKGLKPYMAFSEDLCEEALRSDLTYHLEGNYDLTLSDKKRIVSRAKEDLLDAGFYDTREAVNAALSWTCPVTGHSPFQEFYEHQIEDYDFGFVFACHAIVWGIAQYDRTKHEEAA